MRAGGLGGEAQVADAGPGRRRTVTGGGSCGSPSTQTVRSLPRGGSLTPSTRFHASARPSVGGADAGAPAPAGVALVVGGRVVDDAAAATGRPAPVGQRRPCRGPRRRPACASSRSRRRSRRRVSTPAPSSSARSIRAAPSRTGTPAGRSAHAARGRARSARTAAASRDPRRPRTTGGRGRSGPRRRRASARARTRRRSARPSAAARPSRAGIGAGGERAARVQRRPAAAAPNVAAIGQPTVHGDPCDRWQPDRSRVSCRITD